MTEYRVEIKFFEPYRQSSMDSRQMKALLNNCRKRGSAPGQVREFGYARLKPVNGRWYPCITGTLLRSMLLREVEEVLARKNGSWMDMPCCPGEYLTPGDNNATGMPRRRATPDWSSALDPCDTHAHEDCCTLCLLLGRCDPRVNKIKQHSECSVRFGNLMPAESWFSGLEPVDNLRDIDLRNIGLKRVLNRRDQQTGKAGDTFSVWEVDRITRFHGIIEINNTLAEDRKRRLTGLLKTGLALIGTISGAACEIRLIDAGQINDEGPEQQESSDGVTGDDAATESVNEVLNAVRTAQEERKISQARLRTLADAIRALRSRNPQYLDLPSGTVNHQGGQRPHVVWDISVAGDEKLRSYIEDAAGKAVDRLFSWRIWCDSLGQGLYKLAKSGGQPQTSRIRPLGVAHQHRHPGSPESWHKDSRVVSTPAHEWIITGTLKAETPFHIGHPGSGDDHTSMQVLLNRDNHFKLPHSAQRGALREYLNLATGGLGCSAHLGPERPCQCPVCRVLRRVQLLDAVSETRLPPDIRYRNRKNPDSGIVDEGALFDMETGPQGTKFPFVLRWRGGDNLNKYINIVLQWWQGGCCFLGGQTGTGKGRFRLDDIAVWRWDLEQGRQKYLNHCGVRNPNNLNELTEDEDAGVYKKELVHDFKPFPMVKISWKMSFAVPVLTADPIAALVQKQAEGDPPVSDAVFFQKTVVDENGDKHSRFALKGESIRGLWRHAVGRSGLGGRLLQLPHTECECLICKIFGNEHHAGKIHIEDLDLVSDTETKTIDHVSIDRFDNSVVQKYDEQPLIGSPDREVEFKGSCWLSDDLDDEERDALLAACKDIRDGMYPVGGRSAGGTGWLRRVEIIEGPDWLQEEFKKEAASEPDTPPGAPPDNIQDPCEYIADNNPPQQLFYPHYFLKPADTFKKRTTTRTSHAFFDPDKHSGRIRCTLTALTPLIVPDTEHNDFFGLKAECEGHRNYDFFRLNNSWAVPGSAIRAVISTIYETLTNSCFRVMNQKRVLTRRMEADDAREYIPGQVVTNGTEIKPMKQIRLPLYDDESATAAISSSEIVKKELSKSDENRQGKIKSACQHNEEMAATAGHNRKILAEWRETGSNFFEKMLTGKEQIRFTLPDNANSPTAIASLLPFKSQEGKIGFFKLTGPNNANTKLTKQENSNYNKDWDPLDFNFRLDGGGEFRPSLQNEYPRPVKTCVYDGKEYRITKRCERIFYNDKETGPPVVLPRSVRDQYKSILEEYEKNTDTIAKPLRTFFDHYDLQDGDLVYFRYKNDDPNQEVESVIPVSVSRSVDKLPMGLRLPQTPENNLQPCAHVCLAGHKDCESCSAKDCKPALYREGYPINGLCPACHLFGTSGYKGRVRFGYAFLQGEPEWVSQTLDESTVQSVTLPLLERPRPTWVLRKPNNIIPGRKFYVHHGGWHRVLEGENPWLEGDKLTRNEKNETVQALAPGSHLEFDVFYENLDDRELGLLLYSLELETGLAHKLGKAKSCGFGSVSIQVKGMKERNSAGVWLEREDSDRTTLKHDALDILRQELSGNGNDRSWEDLFNDFKKLLGFRQDAGVRYPQLKKKDPDDDIEGYEELKLKKRSYNPNSELARPWSPWWPPSN